MTAVRLCFILLLAVLLSGCGTQNTNLKGDLIPPELRIHQVGGQAFAARHVTGPISVNLQVDIFNPSQEQLTLTRLRVESMGFGAYDVAPTSQAFELMIAPDKVGSVRFWVPATAQSTIVGANGPVTLRATAYFATELGNFQKIYVQQVNAEAPRPFNN